MFESPSNSCHAFKWLSPRKRNNKGMCILLPKPSRGQILDKFIFLGSFREPNQGIGRKGLRRTERQLARMERARGTYLKLGTN